jgi:hypothetical protein
MSTYNKDVQHTQIFLDKENYFLLKQNKEWNPNGENGKGDAIGRNLKGFIAWGDERLIYSIEQCWVPTKRKTWIGRLLKGKYYLQGYRYPTYARGEEEQPVGLSRDHTFNTVLAYKLSGKSEKEIWEFVRKLKFRISDFAVHTIDLWLWERVMAGRKFAKWIYPFLQYVVVSLTVWWQLKIEKLIKIGPHYEEHQDKYKCIKNEDKPEIIKKLVLLLYPTYALGQMAGGIRMLDDGKWKSKIQKKLLKITPTYNYVIRLLLGDDTVTEKEVMSYKPMTSSRWTGNLNKWWDDRGTKKYKKNDPLIEYNVLDVDYLKALWELTREKN